jgi:hypothetical protein
MALRRDWIASPNYSSRGGSAVRLAVIHTAEGSTSYQSLGSYFAGSSSGVSSHTGIDDTPNTVGEYVHRGDKAWTQANANPYSVASELCAFAAWDRPTWLAHPQMLANTTAWLQEECAAFGIPFVRIGADAAQSGGRGVCGHVDLGQAGGGHWDPGPDFPWDVVMGGTAPPAPDDEEDKEMIICSTPSGGGYIAVKPDGSVFAYGDAQYLGGANQAGNLSSGDKVTDAAYVGKGAGYWLIAKSGSVFAYGDAQYLGGPNAS